MPAYKYHPSQGDAGPEFGRPLLPPDDPRAGWIEQYVVRAREVATRWVDLAEGGRLAHQPYVTPPDQGGLVEPGHYCLEMLHLGSQGCTDWYTHEFEVAVMVWDGVLSGEWAEAGQTASARLAARDLVQVPAGQQFRLRNDGPRPVQAAAIIGTATPPPNLWG
jgi:hypothetical protein